MIDTNSLLVGILILLNVVFFFLGYIIGKISHSQADYGSQSKPFRQKNQPNIAPTQISIDETKYVTDINLSGLEKKYDKLGETVVSSGNISSSINKLKNIKT
jgi:hypothetical protein